jgi:UDP-glucose 4-epimerase
MTAEKKLIVVTGGEGFVGSHLCARLSKDGNRVISLDNHFVPPAPRTPGVDYRVGHTKDIARLVPETPDLIYHLGEYSRVHKSVEEPELVEDLNIVGTRAVVEYWKEKKCKLVYAGSSTKFESWDIAPYTRAKAENTELVARVGEENRLPYAVVYFYNIYGPGERGWDNFGTVVETFRQNMLAGRPHTVNAPGTQTRAFTHVFDTVEGLVIAGEKAQGEGYTISSGEVHSIREVAEMFGGPIAMGPQTKTSRSAGADDSSKMRALGWAPAHTLAEYIEECKHAS